MRIFLLKIINKFFRLGGRKTIPTKEKVVYLTFDDGPEKGITEFVLDELNKYNFKATFFCRGDNAKNHPYLIKRIRKEGHSIANHTFSHIHAYDISTKSYVEDVKRADEITDAILFRPPHGSLTLRTWWKLRKREIVSWSLNSDDSSMDKFNFEKSLANLKSKTQKGDIVLFHFCHRHEKETRQLLPEYVKWLSSSGFVSKAIIAQNNRGRICTHQ